MSLLVVGCAALFGGFGRIGELRVNWRVAAAFALAGLPAVFAGAAVNGLLPPAITFGGFAVLMVVAGLRMLVPTQRNGTACRIGTGPPDWRRCLSRCCCSAWTWPPRSAPPWSSSPSSSPNCSLFRELPRRKDIPCASE
ncbi:sulfite exporter TauE/SafE family protein [Nocardia farcinica]|uniref:TSUP family transporter n=1 Tax=Nocardia farcinica TaxID=37329 RepID=UPI00189368DF|nr:sulfite exporter TauE/SafE family protein [Nocardia farcinica]